MRERVAANAHFALDKLPQPADLRSQSKESLVEQHALTQARETGAATLPRLHAIATSAAGPAVGASATRPIVARAVLNPAKRRLFACFGLPRSGSTWMFNLVREICEEAGIEHLSRYREGVENLPWDEAAERMIVSKSHWPWDSYIAFFREHEAKGVITVRDPRDSVVSLVQRRLNGEEIEFQEALKQVVHSAWRQVVMERELRLPVFRYEDRFVGSADTFNAISRMLGATLGETQRSAILAKLTPERVRTTLDALGSMAENLGDAVWKHDPKALTGTTITAEVQRLIEAQWQRDHIGDGVIGKFRGNLTPEQECEILNQTQEYCKKFDYESDPKRPLHALDKAPAAALLTAVGDDEGHPPDPPPSPREGERAGPAVDATRTFASCPVCGTGETTKPRPDLEPHPYVVCRRCGLFYQPHMLPKVFEGHHESRGDLMSEADRQANRQLARAFYHNHLARRYKGRELFHLDIGSKYPFFGHCLQTAARESGTPLTSHGIDGIPEAREFGRQLGVLMAIGDFEADPQTWDMSPEMRERVALGGFHCVSLIHCLEHFYNPVQTLRYIRRLMVEGGILFVRSPDSKAPGVEGDFTSGHYSIHPTIWCEGAMYEALAKLQDAFAVYETYEIFHQRDYLLQAINRKPTIGVGLGVENDNKTVASAIESVSAVADRFCVRHTGLPDSFVESLEKLVGERLDVGPCQGTQSQGDQGRHAEDLARARNEYVEALDHDVDWVLRLDPEETVPPDTRDIVRRALYMPFDVHAFQVRTATEAYLQSRLWRTKRGVRYFGATEENPVCPADFRVRDWKREILHSGVSRAAAVLENYRTLKADAESAEAGGQRMFEFAKACRDAYGVTNEKHYLEEAIPAFERCLDGDPSCAGDAYRLMAVCYADLGRDWEAAAAGRRALEYAPHDEAFRTWMRDRTPQVINILRPGAIGDVLASSAVTVQLAARNPDAEIHYYTKMPEMAKLLVGIHKVCDADEWAMRKPGADFSLVGYPIAEGYPEQPMRKHLTAYLCDEARLPPGLPRLREEELEPFDIGGCWITIHPKSGWSAYKDWGLDKWNEIVRRTHRDHPDIAIVQIGAADDPALEGIDSDLRGRTSLSQCLWLIKHSALHLGCDSFSNHAAGAFRHPAVIVFGSTSPTGSGYASAVNLWAGLDCSPCYREDPRISRQNRGPCINPPGQEYDRPRHACMAAIVVETVWEAIDGLLVVGTAARGDAVHVDQAGSRCL
jgi:ADP-heptose:LPS heptosyltransferase